MKSNVRFVRSFALTVIWAVSAQASSIVYNNIPGPLPPNLPSIGYQATQTAEFGGIIAPDLSGDYTLLESATVAMSDWALRSNWAEVGDATGFVVPLTLNLYNPGEGGTVGTRLGSVTTDAVIPWRPEADPTCYGGAYRGADGQCYNGSLSTVTFDFSSLEISLPATFVYGLAFDTTNWGYDPTDIPGPYESLNFGLSITDPSVGSDPLPDTAYWNTSTAADYADKGAAGVGVFRQDTGWTPYAGAISFEVATPEPATFGLLGLGFLLIGWRCGKQSLTR